MTHAELVERAAKWLRSQGFGTVIAENLYGGDENPDAIGWKCSGHSLLVECKVSRSDFLADAAKSFRKHPSLGMGVERVYMTTPGVIRRDELTNGWGLVEVRGQRVVTVVKPTPRYDINKHAEIGWLVKYIRRVEGMSKRVGPKVSSCVPME